MKNLFKYIGITSILIFSFYYTEKMNSVVINNSSLMTKINEVSNEYDVVAVSAEIDGEYIVPGLKGKKVNVLKSYNNMKALDVFNAYYLIYDQVYPKTSLENNKDKIIRSGNILKNSVAIVVENNIDIINYSNERNLKITRLINYDTYDKLVAYEQINNDYDNFHKVEIMLNNINKNKNICVINDLNIDICKKENKYLVEPTITLNHYNLSNLIDSIESGYIILIKDSVNLADYKILIKQILYQNLNIINLSELIKE